VDDALEQLVKPAVEGTLNVLRSCQNVPELKRVILTSSMAAITDAPDGVLTEAVWNTKSSLKRNPYYYSKTQAEKAAWDFVQQNSTHFSLVAINPFLIMGPSHPPSLNESTKLIVDLVNGVYPVIMGLNFGIVDVRDVALAHILAMKRPSASGRYVCFNNVFSMTQLVEFIRVAYPQYSAKLPTTSTDCCVGNVAMKALASFQPAGVRDFLQGNLGKSIEFDNSKIVNELGMTFRKSSATVRDTVANLEFHGHLGQPTGQK